MNAPVRLRCCSASTSTKKKGRQPSRLTQAGGALRTIRDISCWLQIAIAGRPGRFPFDPLSRTARLARDPNRTNRTVPQ